MKETRNTEIIETELEEIKTSNGEEQTKESSKTTDQEVQEEEIDPRVEKRDQLFEEIKGVLLNQERVLKKFFQHSDEHCEFDYEEMGLTFEEEEDHLRRTNKLKDKILDGIEENIETQCNNRAIDTLHNMIICDTSYQEDSFRVVIEVSEDSFDLEII